MDVVVPYISVAQYSYVCLISMVTPTYLCLVVIRILLYNIFCNDGIA